MHVLSMERRVAVVEHLTDGAGVRAASRLTRVHKTTILSLILELGIIHRSRDMLALVSSACCPLHDEPLPCEVPCVRCAHRCWDHVVELGYDLGYTCRVQGCACRRAIYQGRSYIYWDDDSPPIPESDFADVNEAAEAIRCAMGWAEVHFYHFDWHACAVYATAEEAARRD